MEYASGSLSSGEYHPKGVAVTVCTIALLACNGTGGPLGPSVSGFGVSPFSPSKARPGRRVIPDPRRLPGQVRPYRRRQGRL